jgi:pimeloyl-ACP methyl ester carboxylesterase
MTPIALTGVRTMKSAGARSDLSRLTPSGLGPNNQLPRSIDEERTCRDESAQAFTLTISRRDCLPASLALAAAATGLSPGRSRANNPEAPDSAAISPFKYIAQQDDLDDLKERLARTRWPEREPVGDWSQGVPLAKLRALVEYWRTAYDWRRCEDRLNSFAQYRTKIDGLNIHFLHVHSRHPSALPIIITHGWPGAVVEFFKVIDPLTNPTAHGGRAEDAFHVVAPSLPGFAFSDKPAERGWNATRIARAWSELMRRLGYDRYVAQGGDWGSVVTTMLAHQRPAGLVGIHLNFPIVFPDPVPTKGLSAAEQRAVDDSARFRKDEFGYFLEQSTRPQTIGYALADSPVGQAAWIYEKFRAWTDNKGDPESALSRDEMLDIITLYWLTNTGASSARIYFEEAARDDKNNNSPVDLPVGCSIFPREIMRTPRSWAERIYPKLIHWNELDRGGHFAAFEQPALFTKELRDCFRSLR